MTSNTSTSSTSTSTNSHTSNNNTAPYWVKATSGSVGSILTALAVTPLEVVKVRQQQQGSSVSSSRSFPSNVSLCPRGCGTFVLNNGISDCVLPKSAVPYFDATSGNLKAMSSNISNISSSSERMMHSHTTTTTHHHHRGTFSTLQRIFLQEGVSGIYAGLGATLVMGVPNTVLYFVSYDELISRLRSNNRYYGYGEGATWTPAVAGALARLGASLSTAPLELIRTRQASHIGSANTPGLGVMGELRSIIRSDGVAGLYRGLSPTLLRDVPFSAVYWFSLELLRDQWKQQQQQQSSSPNNNNHLSGWQQAGQALVNGSIAGMIAAAVTTPLDVIKTRRQVQQVVTTVTEPSSMNVVVDTCRHEGAVAYHRQQAAASTFNGTGTLALMKNILHTQGVAGLWRGNQTRMIKVAPACAIMISSYEMGKRYLGLERID